VTSPAIVRPAPGREAGRPSRRRPHWPRWSRKTRRDLRIGLLFITPWLVGFAAFYLYPALASLYYSFTDFRILQAPKWVGLDNYAQMLADPQFWKALGNTLYITVLGVPLAVMTALGIALLLNVKKIAGIGVFRTIFYLPVVVPLSVPALITVGLFTFIDKWTDFFGPRVYLNDPEQYPLSIAIQTFQAAHKTDWPLSMAASTVITLPLVLIYFFAQRKFIQGITLTGIKG
jgi:ABC-type glycerol-3-phosphate transport system permease component